MDRSISLALRKADRRRTEYDDALFAAEEALTVWMEQHFAELVKRIPKRRFQASSGMGSLSIEITPGPFHPLEHHREFQRYVWIWGTTVGSDRHWAFLWEPWEELLDEFAERTGQNYVNFTRDIEVTGEKFQERGD
jgi:hypothetical protein